VYDTPGRYDVTLESSNTIGTGTETKTEMIVVGAPNANFSATSTYLTLGESTDFMDESSGDPTEWTWTFTGGVPASSYDENPTGIQYDASGAYPVTLEVMNEYGENTITKEDFIVVDGPFAEFEADNTNILVGESVTFTDMSINNPTSWSWKFFGGSPGSHNGQEPPAVTYNAAGDYNVKLTVSNDLGTNFLSKDNYIHVGTIGISEAELEAQMKIYPNPTQGSFTLQLGETSMKGATVSVINAKGEMLYNHEVSSDQKELSIDLGDVASGIYMLHMQLDGYNINKKLTVVK
jgi:PKD repeat protein